MTTPTSPPEYRVEYTTAAARQVRKLESGIRRRILTAIAALANDPRPTGTKALQGTPGYRIRIGDYRILYVVTDDTVTVLIFRVAHRSDVYRT